MVSISACHAEDPGSIPGGGVSICSHRYVQPRAYGLKPLVCDSVSERLRRWTRNPLGSARRGSNPLAVVLLVNKSFVRYIICSNLLSSESIVISRRIWNLRSQMTPVGFEPTPFRNGALSHRLRPLGQSVSVNRVTILTSHIPIAS